MKSRRSLHCPVGNTHTHSHIFYLAGGVLRLYRCDGLVQNGSLGPEDGALPAGETLL